MDSLFHHSLGISVLFHLLFFTFGSFSLLFQKQYIFIPVDMIHYSPPRIEEVKEPVKKREEEPAVAPKKRERRREKPKPEPRPEPDKKEEPLKAAQQQQVQQRPPLAPSSTLVVDTAKFPYLFYLRKIRERISNNWAWKGLDAGSLKSVVHFKIRRDGSVVELRLRERSGDAVFDNLAVRAVKVSSPFPPLPVGYEDDTLGVYFEFAYKE